MPSIDTGTLEILVAKAKSSQTSVLQFRRFPNQLVFWRWPIAEGSLMKPSDFERHRTSHQVLGPCCLCPFIESTGPDFVESVICVVTQGPFAGEYAAMCARDKCGYFVPAERLYNEGRICSNRYPLRAANERIPPQVIRASANREVLAPARPLKRTYAMLDINDGLILRRRAPLPARGGRNSSSLMELLECRPSPGVTESEFRKLFAKCDCGLITTREAFKSHRCLTEVIDLTGED